MIEIHTSRASAGTSYALYWTTYDTLDADFNNFYDSNGAKVYYNGSSCTPCSWDSESIPGVLGDNDIGEAPNFVNAAKNDFRLSSDSLCIGAGDALTDDLLANSSDNPITIRGKTYCTGDSCDELLSLGYGLGAGTEFTEGKYAPVWQSREDVWDLGAVIDGSADDNGL